MRRVLLIMAVVSIAAGVDSALGEQPSLERSVTASHQTVAKNCYPCLARLDDGRLLIVWCSWGDEGSSIIGAFSTDHGRTWSAPNSLIKTPGGRDYDPSIVVSGKSVLVTCTTPAAGDGIHSSKTWCTRSDDQGRTWTAPYEIPMNRVYTCGKTHHGLRLRSGTLVMGYSWDVLCQEGKTLKSEGQMHLRAGVMISTDNGKTWQNGGDTDAEYKKIGSGSVDGTDEPAIVELDDGSIYMLMRTGSDHLYEARSTDEGRTFHGIGPSPLGGSNAPAALCRFEVDGRRGILAVWDNAVQRYPLCAAASFDGGRTWSEPKDIAGPTDGRQASYPSCEQAADGTLVAVWQQDVPGGRDVCCARFGLGWLVGKREPRWSGNGSCRMLVSVPPRDLKGRASDEMPARLHVDLAEMLAKQKVPGRPDVGHIQVIRYNAATGEPIAYGKFRGHGADEVPFRFDDFDRRGLSFWYAIEGNGHAGALVWLHRQEGKSPGHYAIYFDAVPADRKAEPSPLPLLGDCDALYTDQSDGFLITALHCKPAMADFNGDGLLDLLVGEIQGHLFYFQNCGTPKEPKFAQGKFLLVDGQTFRLLHYTTPCAVDWDDDGDLDLLVGHANGGQVVLLENTGTRTEPVYVARGRLEADGTPIAIPHELSPGESFLGQEYMAKPEAADWDGDGDTDLLVGGYVSGSVFYFENTRNGRGVPSLSARGPIQADGKVLRIGSGASPCVADFDGDGDLDLITAKGEVIMGRPDRIGMAYFENVGSRTSPVLKERPFPQDQPASVGMVGVPCTGDFNGDGLPDLVIGTMDHVRLYPNVGSRQQPRFQAGEMLKNKWGPVATGAFATAPVDWDGDGNLDLVSSTGGHFALKLSTDALNPARWADGGLLKAGGKTIQYVFPLGDSETFPVVADLNRDGLFDLLQGVAAGDVWYYRNVGAAGKPELAEGIRLPLAEGGFVKVGRYKQGDQATDFASHSGDRSDPRAADFDGDGDLDLMVSDAYGIVTYFENVGGNERPAFAPGVQVLHESDARALIAVTDFDRDGRPDILLAQGSIRVYRNVGKGKEQKFQGDRELLHQYIPYPHPYVVDFNGDGDEDLLISSSYGVAYLMERSYAEAGCAEGTLLGVERKP